MKIFNIDGKFAHCMSRVFDLASFKFTVSSDIYSTVHHWVLNACTPEFLYF